MATQSRTHLSAALRIAALGALTVSLWQVLTVRFNLGNNWTALFMTGDREKIPQDLAPGTYAWKNTEGYDGQWYRYVAHDPLFGKDYARVMDDPRLRYRRILVPGLAYLLAAGQTKWIDSTYILVVSLSVFMGIYWSARYLARYGRHPAWGLIFVLLPATMVSFDRMLVDATLAALFAGFMLYSETKVPTKAYLVSTLAFLTRETGFLLIAAGAGAAWKTGHRRRALLFLSAAIPALAWYVFVWHHTRTSGAGRIFSLPVVNLIRRVFTLRDVPVSPAALMAVRVFDLLAIMGLLTSIALTLHWAWRERNAISPGALAASQFALLGLFLGHTKHLSDAYIYSRPVSPMLLFVMLRGIATGAWWALAAPLAISLSVGVYFVNPALNILKSTTHATATPQNGTPTLLFVVEEFLAHVRPKLRQDVGQGCCDQTGAEAGGYFGTVHAPFRVVGVGESDTQAHSADAGIVESRLTCIGTRYEDSTR